MADFYQGILPVEKEATERLECSSFASPAAGFPMPPRRYTDSASTDNTMWHGGFLSRFANQGGCLDVFSAPTGYDESNILFGSSYPPRLIDRTPLRQPISNTTSETRGDLIRRVSSKKRSRRRRRSSAARCNLCTTPDRPGEGQTRFLRDLPTELLLLIFEFAYLSPIKFPRCEHGRKHASSIGPHLARRATANSYFSDLPSSSSSPTPRGLVEFDTSSTNHDDPPQLSDSLRIYRAKTLLYIALTCRDFNNMLLDRYIDETFWRSAARWCWGWLPENLADVQGREITHQTSWRNLVGVFMRSENGLFKQNGGGKGGVESFGGNRECSSARLWKDERIKYLLGSPQAVENKKKSKLLMVCAQPGPDLFHVTQDGGGGKYTLSLSLRGRADYFITLDEYGRFGKKPARLPGGLKRTERGYFQSDIFEVEGERFQLVKIWKGRDQSTPAPLSGSSHPRIHHPKQAVKEIITWDLHCVDEFESDPKASVARCSSEDGWLVFNLFTHRDYDDSNIELLFDPPEDSRLFCVQAFGYPGCRPSQATGTDGNPRYNGKMKATDFIEDYGITEPTTIFRWRREFEYEKAADFQLSLYLHYVICNFKLNSTSAVVLIRWNVRTAASNEELVDRQFHILDLKTGDTIRILQFPNLYWDHRHHDMSVEYNEMRHKKMSQLYNHMIIDETMGAGNRCTRIHEDDFILTEDKIISGSHDYCNWLWDLKADNSQDCSEGIFNARRNDAGVADPFEVLDDFYWDEEQDEGAAAGCRNKESWNTSNERAGWWVKTPNQIMCFWHGIAGSADGRYLAACRPGKMFLWDLKAGRNKVVGYKNFESRSNSNNNNRWLGRLAAHAENLKHRLRNWFVWEEVLPEQGLWLLFDDLEAVYLDRDDILHACGFGSGKPTWPFQRDDFTFDSDGGNDGRGTLPEDVTSDEEEDEGEESDEEDELFGRVKRTRTNSFGVEELGVLFMSGDNIYAQG